MLNQDQMTELLEKAFSDTWAEFQVACAEESGKEHPASKAAPGDEAACQKPANTGDGGQTLGKPGEKQQDKYFEVLAEGKKRAQAVFTDPGCSILNVKGAWTEDSLKAAMSEHGPDFSRQGKFLALYHIPSDQEARVPPNLNKCMLEPEANKERLKSFCAVANTMMSANQDACVIGCGRSTETVQVALEVITLMKWESRSIIAITDREHYDKFIISGNPCKKRRTTNGLTSLRYTVHFFVCWKASQEKLGLQHKKGRRKFVDVGYPIISDVVLNVPQVQLSEIYSVTPDTRKRCLGEANSIDQRDKEDRGFHFPL